MDLPLSELIERLSKHPIYPALFERAYGERKITRERIADALAQFVKSIVSYSTPDDYLRAYEDGRLAWEKIPPRIQKLWRKYLTNNTVMTCGPCHTLAQERGQNMFDDVGLESFIAPFLTKNTIRLIIEREKVACESAACFSIFILSRVGHLSAIQTGSHNLQNVWWLGFVPSITKATKARPPMIWDCRHGT
jgi:hypothetical protein